MTVSAGPSVKTRTPAVRTRPDTTGGRSGAALRAYERRQQRQSVHESDAARPGRSKSSGTGSTIAARIPFVALIIGMLALGMGVTLLLTTRAAADSYSLSEAKTVNLDLVQQQASLERDVELADSAPELARRAAELGMVPAGNVARLLVGVDGGVQIVGTPLPADGKPVAPLDPPTTVSPSTTAASGSARPQGQSNTSSTGGSATSASVPVRSASSPGAGAPTSTITTPPSVPAVSAATPSAVNGAGSQSLGEQLVPMTIPSAAPAGSGQ